MLYLLVGIAHVFSFDLSSKYYIEYVKCRKYLLFITTRVNYVRIGHITTMQYFLHFRCVRDVIPGNVIRCSRSVLCEKKWLMKPKNKEWENALVYIGETWVLRKAKEYVILHAERAMVHTISGVSVRD